jgi:hypothetical protein
MNSRSICVVIALVFLQRGYAQQVTAPDAIRIDSQSEALFARLRDRDVISLDQVTVGALEKLSRSLNTGLVFRSSLHVDPYIHIKHFKNPKQLATRLLQQRSYLLNDDGDEVATLLDDIDTNIAEGRTALARSMLYALAPQLRASIAIRDSTDASMATKVSWYETLQLNVDSKPMQLDNRLLQLWMRLLQCSLIDQDADRFKSEAGLISDVVAISESDRQQLALWEASIDALPQRESSFDANEFDLRSFTSRVWLNEYDDLSFDPPRSFLPGYPSPPIHVKLDQRNLFFVRHGNQLYGWNADSKATWPSPSNRKIMQFLKEPSITTASIAEETSLGAITTSNDRLFLLIDSMALQDAISSEPGNALIGLDLRRDASLMPNTPLLSPSILAGNTSKADSASTFIGTPLAVEDQLFVLIQDKKASTTSFRVACFDSDSMELRWLSDAFGCDTNSTSPSWSSTAMLHQQGRLFVATGHGSFVSIDAADGELAFQINYTSSLGKGFASPQAIFHRTSMIAHRDSIIFQPSDSEFIASVDWHDGQFHWFVPTEIARRNRQLVGVVEDEILCIGDRIAWIDSASGQITSTVSLPISSVSTNGSAIIFDEKIVWSNGLSIFEYPARRTIKSKGFTRINEVDLVRWPYKAENSIGFSISANFISVALPSAVEVFGRNDQEN